MWVGLGLGLGAGFEKLLKYNLQNWITEHMCPGPWNSCESRTKVWKLTRRISLRRTQQLSCMGLTYCSSLEILPVHLLHIPPALTCYHMNIFESVNTAYSFFVSTQQFPGGMLCILNFNEGRAPDGPLNCRPFPVLVNMLLDFPV